MQEQSFPKAAESTAFRVLLALGLSHLLNDTLQSVITAVYPLLKESMALSFVQIRIHNIGLPDLGFGISTVSRVLSG